LLTLRALGQGTPSPSVAPVMSTVGLSVITTVFA
jgi:hypothetical protein